jgi:two-component system, LytTR family, response regulator
MTLIHTLIIDDDENIRNLIGIYVERYFADRLAVVATADRTASAMAALRAHAADRRADIVFLDIDLTDGTGFEVLDGLTDAEREGLQVIFVTSFKEHAQRAIRYDAVDYLDKPILATEFKVAVQRAITKVEKLRGVRGSIHDVPGKQTVPTDEPPVQALPQQADSIEIRTLAENSVHLFVVPIAEIMYVEAARNYCTIVLEDGTSYTPSLPLKHYEEILCNAGCLRITRSYIVNPEHIPLQAEPTKNGFSALLPLGRKITVEPQFRPAVQALLLKRAAHSKK